MATTGAQLARTRVRPEPAPPRPKPVSVPTPRNPDRIDASPLLTSPQHPGGVNEQADLRRARRAFIAAAFDGLTEEHVPPRAGGIASIAPVPLCGEDARPARVARPRYPSAG